MVSEILYGMRCMIPTQTRRDVVANLRIEQKNGGPLVALDMLCDILLGSRQEFDRAIYAASAGLLDKTDLGIAAIRAYRFDPSCGALAKAFVDIDPIA